MKRLELHNPTEFPIKEQGEEYSVDVCIIDEFGLHGLGFYNYDTQRWEFHTDTLIDYNEKGNETEWMWYHPVVEWEDAKKWNEFKGLRNLALKDKSFNPNEHPPIDIDGLTNFIRWYKKHSGKFYTPEITVLNYINYKSRLTGGEEIR